jgi:hypothetical protein
MTPLGGQAAQQPPPSPWTWSNLTDDDARTLEAAVEEWIKDYNQHLAVNEDDVIPACWRQHPTLSRTYLILVLPKCLVTWGYVKVDASAFCLQHDHRHGESAEPVEI